MIPETIKNNPELHQHMANALRFLAADAVEHAASGHPGMPMGMADVATVLFTKHLKFSGQHPDWPDRDRFVLSAGHGSMLLYGLLHLSGYAEMPISALKSFRRLGSVCTGHPEYGEVRGIETTTGPLGQGVANAVGMALAECIMAAHFSDLVQHNTYFIAGDGCLMEGICQEAITFAGHLRLGNLIGLFDDNGTSIDGAVSLTTSEDQVARFVAAGWHVQTIDGHDAQAIDSAIAAAKLDRRPSLIVCKTTIGVGAPNKAGTAKSHGSPLGAEELAAARQDLAWTAAAFEVPTRVQEAWAQAGQRHVDAVDRWYKALQKNPQKEEFERRIVGQLPQELDVAFDKLLQQIAKDKPTLASRAASQMVLDAIAPTMPELIGGSADLTGSNNTRASGQRAITAEDFSGHYVHYGIREHAMAAVMNGMILHGGVVPYGGTFLVFSDYCRPAVRLAALMNIRTIFVFSHDSIGLGEDGPTHQPVEHLASLRAIPNLSVYRPADALETAESWQMAMRQQGPSALILSRQKLPALHRNASIEHPMQQGGYVLLDSASPDICLIATGSEAECAVNAQQALEKLGIKAKIISMPCLDTFQSLDEKTQDAILGSAPRIVIEAAIQQSWDRLLRRGDHFIGMTGFGASAPASDLYRHFGITAEAIVKTAQKILK
ncbi:MAG: transketolase [Alphaproteobacteria bacterium]|nr:transketolase [Alphaproteobacteria bacterium]